MGARTLARSLAFVGLLACGRSDAAPDATPDVRPAASPVRLPPVVVVAPRDTVRPVSLVLNIPAFRLDVYRRDTLVHSYPVTVGQAAHPTPRGRYAIEEIVWAPWWHPPKVEWAKTRKVTRPGPANPVGRAKMNFVDDVFLHGGAVVGAVRSPASHGCVRLRNADILDLAEWILLAVDTIPVDVHPDSLAARRSDDTTTRLVRLPQRVPIAVRYDRVERRGDSVLVHPDIYGLTRGASPAQQLASALGRPAADTMAFPVAAARALAWGAGRRIALALADTANPDALKAYRAPARRAAVPSLPPMPPMSPLPITVPASVDVQDIPGAARLQPAATPARPDSAGLPRTTRP